MLQIIHCTVNGKEQEIAVDPRESLTDMLHNKLELTSVKRGCEVGECGACTVLVDGKAIDSCIYLAVWADGKHILTVEGLQGPNGELNPIQQAFIDEAAVQCGFCIPGIIMSAVEIAGTGKSYTREEIRKLISGHLCRCTGYQNITNAVEKAVNLLAKKIGRQGSAGFLEKAAEAVFSRCPKTGIIYCDTVAAVIK
jgi:carbon-monoxide dehydrogenase small subunit